MILNNTQVNIDSNIQPTKSLNFGISDVRLVVDILSKLYAYPIRTLVQEYICNGRDAMREGKTWGKLPIEITVPNTLDPVFKVRDFGVGISPDRMETIFVNYGSSTKRNTNTQTGGFGIGAKSAFSYTDSFTVTSYFNGVKYLYVAHLGDEGGVNLVSQEKTTQHNGVEISIGVKPKDIPEFRNAIQRCVRFWEEPIKFLGSKDIHQLKPSLTLGNMNIYECSSDEDRTIYLIDGIEYDLMESKNSYGYTSRVNNLNSGSTIVALTVPNGHFKIASSRERIENNDDNKSKQDSMIVDAKKQIDNVILTKVNNPNLPIKKRIEYRQTYSGLSQIAGISIDLGQGYKLSGDAIHCPVKFTYRGVRRGRRASTHFELFESTRVDLSYIVYSTKDSSNTVARKLNHYLDSNRDKYLVNKDVIDKIPHGDILFTNILDADSLPLPPKKVGTRTAKTTRDAICWNITPNGDRNQWTVETLNTRTSPCVFVDAIDSEATEIARFLNVIMIPKSNKDLVLKKGMTLEQGKKYLLSKHKQAVLGLSNLPHNYNKVDVLKHFNRRTESADIQAYLFKNFVDLKAEYDKISAEYVALVNKYPLITVLSSLDKYSSNSSQIVVDEINKQSKGK